MSRDSRQPIEDLSSGASASGCVSAGARCTRIWENFDRSKGAGVNGVTVSRR